MLPTSVCVLLLTVLLLTVTGLLFRQLKLTQRAAEGSGEWKRLYEQAHRESAAAIERCRELERQNSSLSLRLGAAKKTVVLPNPEKAGVPAAVAEQPVTKQAPKVAEPLTLVLPIQLLSKNVRDRLHWRQQRQLKTDYLNIIRAKYRLRATPQVKQRATVTRVRGPRERDFDEQNIGAGSAVELIDALTAAGYWVDDSPTWLETNFKQTAGGKVKGPAVVVEIEVLG